MNHCSIQRTSNFSSFGNGAPVVCPKPRRLNLLNTSMNEPEFLDLMSQHTAGGYGYGYGNGYGSPEQVYTPFFSGSPPSRVSNPLIQDARFQNNDSIVPNPSSGMLSSSPAARKQGIFRGNKPSVRIEGFNCLDRDNRRNCSVPALA